MNRVGLRANYIASVYAARLMVPRGSGLIANISSAGGLTYLFNTAYGVGKAAQDRMAQDFNVELKGTGVYALAVWPGAVKTELIQENILDVNEMPEYVFTKVGSPVSNCFYPEQGRRSQLTLFELNECSNKAKLQTG